MTNIITRITQKVATLGFFGSLMLVATAHSAYGLSYKFSGFNAGIYSASGIFDIDNSTKSNEIDSSSIKDWEINLVNKDSNTGFTLYGPGGAFGVHNSDFVTDSNNTPITAFSNLSMFVFTSDWKISTFDQEHEVANFILEESSINGIGINSVVQESFGIDERLSGEIVSTTDISTTNNRELLIPNGSSSVSTSNTPTTVPFDPSANTGIATLAGLWVLCRFRKTLGKSKSNQEKIKENIAV